MASASLQLNCYQHADKALSVHANGDFVDPYFANRALISAHQLGLAIEPLARDWIKWALAHQEADGRFARYCLRSGHWQRCAKADADDASLALWLQLLYTVSPEEALQGAWRSSASRAELQLNRLYDKRLGIYLVSSTQRYSLFMDNVEIYNALTTIARQQREIRAMHLAKNTQTRAMNLRHAINRVFWRSEIRTYAVSTKREEHESFYPHIVAQVYPWLFDMPTPMNAEQAYQKWHDRYAERWLSFREDKYPWGLVAATAAKLGDDATAQRWLREASALRAGQRWNILEEAIHQGLAKKYAQPIKPACEQGKQ